MIETNYRPSYNRDNDRDNDSSNYNRDYFSYYLNVFSLYMKLVGFIKTNSHCFIQKYKMWKFLVTWDKNYFLLQFDLFDQKVSKMLDFFLFLYCKLKGVSKEHFVTLC